ncbi:MAG: type II secretion system F family protein, partial [Parcubacteria group bacterium]
MLTFSYNALDKFNSYVKGTISADNVKKATALLEKEGFIIVNINQQKGKSFSKFNRLFESVSRVDQMFFTRHLYTMLESGMPLDQVIKVTAEQTTNPTFRQILDSVHDRLVRGQTLHSALNEHKKHFSQLFINLVKVGEMSGKLDKVLEHVLEQQEKDYDLITRARGAMVYPAIIIVALFAMVTMMMVFVIPKVTGILTEYDVELPIATRVLIWLSNFLIHYGFLLVPVLAVLIALFIRWTRSPKGKAKWDGFLLKIPRLKTVLIEFNLARISRALSTLLSSGVQLDQSLELASEVPGNYLYQDSLRSGIKFIQRGIPL